jgi:hypothetical protein
VDYNPAAISTAWEFFAQHASQADSVTEWLSLVFLAVVLLRGYLRVLLPVALLAVIVLAVKKPQVRRSRLVQVGFSIFTLVLLPLLWVGALVTDNPIGLGMLFALLSTIALFLIVIGAILNLRPLPEHENLF